MLLPVSGHGGPALPCPILAWGGLMAPLPGLGSWSQSSKRAGGLLGWLQALGQGPCVPEFLGGEQQGGGPCRDCLEQGGNTQGRAGAGSISLLPFPEAPPAAQAASGVLCPFQPGLRRKDECAGARGLYPMSPLCHGAGAGNCWRSAVPPVCSSGCQGTGDMAGWHGG